MSLFASMELSFSTSGLWNLGLKAGFKQIGGLPLSIGLNSTLSETTQEISSVFVETSKKIDSFAEQHIAGKGAIGLAYGTSSRNWGDKTMLFTLEGEKPVPFHILWRHTFEG